MLCVYTNAIKILLTLTAKIFDFIIMHEKTKNKPLILTITNKGKTKYFIITKTIKLIVASIVSLLLITLTVGTIAVVGNKETLKNYQAQIDLLKNLNNELTAQNKRLTETLDITNFVQKQMDLADNKISQTSKKVQTRNKISGMRLQVPVITAARINQQKLLFDSIPSGYPVKRRKITSNFGNRKHPITKRPDFHNGVDLSASTGTYLYAAADGIVKNSSKKRLSGNRIVIQHNYGFESRYAHLSKLKVKVGDTVEKGDLIGLTGNTGRSNGPHLHYEIRYLGKPLNPKEFLKWEYGDQEIFTKVRGIKWQSLISLINKQTTNPSPALQLSQLILKSKEQ